MRVHVDGWEGAQDRDAWSLSAHLWDPVAMRSAEVQVGQIGLELVIIVAGDVTQDRDPRGNLRLHVAGLARSAQDDELAEYQRSLASGDAWGSTVDPLDPEPRP